jgi:hypothetical protein
MLKKLLMTTAVLAALTGIAEACYVKDPSLNVRNAPDGLVTGSLKTGTLIVIEEVRGDWVHHAPREEVGDAGVGQVHRLGL